MAEVSRRFMMKAAGALLVGGQALVLAGCAKRYHVDYCGKKSWYKGAKDTYPAGARVRLIYDGVATDTEYRFFLDDESLVWEFDGDHSLILTFTMPDHDVVLRCEQRNTMEYDPGEGFQAAE